MKKIIHVLTHPIVVSLIGLALLSALIWFAGPYIKFGDQNTAPLESAVTRLICIMVMLLVWGLNNLRVQRHNNKKNQDLMDDLQEDQADLSESIASDQASEELHQINQRFTRALTTLKKLKFKGRGTNKALYELPWYIIVGPPGAGKTTALVNSSLDFPLAEQFGKGALQGIGGTRNCDWWFTNDAVLVDTAGRYTTQDSHRVVDSSAWEGFLKLLKRHRRRRPINGVIVAISLHDLLIQTDEERIMHAKTIRSRLDELMEKLEIRFPVYLMFTKVDLISGFSQFFEDLGKEEREQVWGVSLPNAPKPSQSPDFDFLNVEFEKLIERLYDRVLWRVHQERDLKRRGAIQCFPQQMENVKAIAENFVRQTFVKNRYQFQPYLRGIYFSSGVQDGTPIDRMMTSVAANFGFSRDVAKSSFQQGKSFFLGNLFRQVIFQESELVGSNRRYEIFIRWAQRTCYVGLAAVTLCIVLIWASSVTKHKVFMSNVQSYIAEFNTENQRINTWNKDIRVVVPILNALAQASIVYDQEEHPWLAGVGLYDSRVDQQADKAYEVQLKSVLLPKLIHNLETYLKQGHYGGDLYNTFRTYMMFNKLEHMDKNIITDWFRSNWETHLHGEASRRKALEKHLQTLLSFDLESSQLNDKLVTQTRKLLLRVPVSQRTYSRIRSNPQYNQKVDMLNYFGESVRGVYKANEQTTKALYVPYMFTIEGYESIDLSTQSPVIASIVNERWLLDEDEKARVDFIEDDLDDISEQVKDHYLSEYSKIWSDLYTALEIAEFQNIGHANDVLTSFTDPVYSPLLAILQVGMTNTQLSNPLTQNLADDYNQGHKAKATSYLADTFKGTKVDKHFRDVNVLLRESSKRTAPIKATIQKIQRLQEFIAEISNAPDPGKKSFGIAKSRYQSGSGNAITELKSYAKSTPQPVRRWLTSLADESWKVVLAAAYGHINIEWRDQVYNIYKEQLAGHYPLVHSSSDELALFDFSEFFKPNGKLDNFYQNYFRPFINTRGRWSNRSVDNRNLGFSGNTLKQVKKALNIKNIFFRNNPKTPSITLELKPHSMDEKDARFTLELGERQITYNHGPKFWKTVTWSGADENKRIRIIFEDLNETLHDRFYEGPWAWFRLQDDAKLKKTSKSNIYHATFSVPNQSSTAAKHSIVYELKAKSVNNLFRNNLLGSFRCPESI